MNKLTREQSRVHRSNAKDPEGVIEESYSTVDLIETWNELIKNEKFIKEISPLPVFKVNDFLIMSNILFSKPENYSLWIIKNEDEKAVNDFLESREAQKRGVPIEMSSIYLRRINFFKEFLKCNFNAAEAARKCGYSYKYAKQVAYRIRRGLY